MAGNEAYNEKEIKRPAEGHEPINFEQLMGEAKFYDAYSKWIDGENRYETWGEAVGRVMDMHRRRFGEKLEQSAELRALFDRIERAVKDKKVLPSMRTLQFGGEQIEKNNLKAYNCGFTYIDRPGAFGNVLYALLAGVGIGFSVQRHHIAELPGIKAMQGEPIDYIIGDSVEGWSLALDALMISYFKGSNPIRFNYSKIRPKGSPVSGGIIAPGPDGLRNSLEQIERMLRSIAQGSPTAPPRADRGEGVQLSPIQCYDILMHASNAVLSGGVRRSATICLFDPDDEEMMSAKTGDWFSHSPMRARSNNSAVLVRSEATYEQFMELAQRTKEWGEPGFAFLEDREHGFNPCFEAALYPRTADGRSGMQLCNLTECVLTNGRSEEDFFEQCRVASWLGTLQAAYTDFNDMIPNLKEITEREALLGVSMTGCMDRPGIISNPDLLKRGAEAVKEANEQMAGLIGINAAARTTLVKPAGTTSIIAGTSSGIHPRHSRRYIRNVQLNGMSPVAQLFKEGSPSMVEDSMWGNDDIVVSFPVTSPPEAAVRDELSAVEHLKVILSVQRHWVANGTRPELCISPGMSHNVSSTITVRAGEWKKMLEMIWEHRKFLAGISLLPDTADTDYPQAPHCSADGGGEAAELFRTISESAGKLEWKHLVAKRGVEAASLAEEACSGGMCEL